LVNHKTKYKTRTLNLEISSTRVPQRVDEGGNIYKEQYRETSTSTPQTLGPNYIVLVSFVSTLHNFFFGIE